MVYDGEKEGYKETITCPYCGKSVIVPENLRVHAPQVINVAEIAHEQMIEMGGMVQPTVITLNTDAPAQAPGPSNGRSVVAWSSVLSPWRLWEW